ncbi:MAG: cytochrome b, partial [Candidatus Lariskella arthropodorum]
SAPPSSSKSIASFIFLFFSVFILVTYIFLLTNIGSTIIYTIFDKDSFILYILMLIMPMSGYVMSVAGGRDVYFFSFELPKLLPINSQLSAISYLVHVNVCYILAAAIVLHILFAIKHLIFDKVNLFARIWRVESAN